MTKILISGGAGFIGSCLIHRLNQLGHTEITIVDRLGKTDKWRNLVGLQYREYMEMDAFRIWRTTNVCDFDIVFALGACSSTREVDASYLAANNLADMISLIRWTYAGLTYFRDIEDQPRFIYASSSATYGLAPSDDSAAPHTLKPLNAYGLSKNMVDQHFERAGWLTKAVGLKYSNVFGPNSEHKGDLISFVAKAYRQIKETGGVTMFDTYKDVPEGQDARDFIYVKDAVEATIHFALGAGTKATGLYNVGAGVATTWRDMALHTIEAMGLTHFTSDVGRSRIRYQPLPESLRGKYQYYTCANISKLRTSGYDRPMTDVKAAIHEYVTKYLAPDKRIGEIGS